MDCFSAIQFILRSDFQVQLFDISSRANSMNNILYIYYLTTPLSKVQVSQNSPLHENRLKSVMDAEQRPTETRSRLCPVAHQRVTLNTLSQNVLTCRMQTTHGSANDQHPPHSGWLLYPRGEVRAEQYPTNSVLPLFNRGGILGL